MEYHFSLKNIKIICYDALFFVTPWHCSRSPHDLIIPHNFDATLFSRRCEHSEKPILTLFASGFGKMSKPAGCADKSQRSREVTIETFRLTFLESQIHTINLVQRRMFGANVGLGGCGWRSLAGCHALNKRRGDAQPWKPFPSESCFTLSDALFKR